MNYTIRVNRFGEWRGYAGKYLALVFWNECEAKLWLEMKQSNGVTF